LKNTNFETQKGLDRGEKEERKEEKKQSDKWCAELVAQSEG
jgi:hypothetical protein